MILQIVIKLAALDENPEKSGDGKNKGTCAPDQGSGATLGVLGYRN